MTTLPRATLRTTPLASLLASALLAAAPAWAQIAVSSNDGKVQLTDDGVVKTLATDAGPDSVTVFDLASSPPRVLAQLDGVPGSVVGPPSTLAVSPDQTLAVVASSMKRDPADAAKLVPDDRLTVIALDSTPPRVLSTVRAGRQPTGVAFSPDGKMVLVANRAEGSISVFGVEGQSLQPRETVALGNANSGPSAVSFTKDGRHALVTRNFDHLVTVLDVAGGKVTVSGRSMAVTQAPYPLVMNPDGKTAIFGSLGGASSANLDIGVVGVIDLTQQPFRVTQVLSVPAIVENVAVSPDGAYVASIAHNGSGGALASPTFKPNGLVTFFRMEAGRLRQIAELPVGRWPQGAAFSKNNELFVQSTFSRELLSFKLQGDQVTATSLRLPTAVLPVTLKTAEWPAGR